MIAPDCRNSSGCSYQNLGSDQDNLLPQHEPWIVLLKITFGECCYCISLIELCLAPTEEKKQNSTAFWEPSSKCSSKLSLRLLFSFFLHFPQEILACAITDSLHLCYLHFNISVLFKDFFTNIVCTILIASFNSKQQYNILMKFVYLSILEQYS